MNNSPTDGGGRASKPSKSLSAMLWVLGFLSLVVVGFTLEREVGIPFDTTFRVVCAGACLVFIHKLGTDFPGERWPRISLWIALAVNISIFLTPLVDRPASRGELMLFALPDATSYWARCWWSDFAYIQWPTCISVLSDSR